MLSPGAIQHDIDDPATEYKPRIWMSSGAGAGHDAEVEWLAHLGRHPGDNSHSSPPVPISHSGEIATLEHQLTAVLGGAASASAAKPANGRRGGRRKLSPEARARIAAAQRARWAKVRGGKPAAKPAKAPGKRGGRRKLSPEARERIAAAQRARWAKVRGGKPAAKPAKAPGKRGGRRKLSPEARERIAAAQRARWAAVRKAK